MTNTLGVGYGSAAISSFTGNDFLYFFNSSISTGGSTTESTFNTVYRSSGTFSKLWVNIPSNSANASTTFQFRKNSTNGNQSLSVPANTTGTFTDASDTDSVTAGDKINVEQTYSISSGTITISSINAVFTPSSNTVVRGGAAIFYHSFGHLFYFPPFGDANNNTSPTTEANAKNRMRKNFTVQNFLIHLGTNANTNSCSAGSRKNGGNGNLAVSIPANTTGDFEDTADSDSVAPGDDFNYFFINGNGGAEIDQVVGDFVSTNSDGILSTASNNLKTLNTNTTSYWGLAGDLTSSTTTETTAQSLVNNAFVFSELTINVQSNTITNSSTLTLRANAASPASGPAVSIPASSTGVFSDSTDTYTSSSTDLMDYQLVTASTGTSMKISHISVFTNVPPTPPAPVGFPRSFRNLPEIPRAPKLQGFGNSAPTFGI